MKRLMVLATTLVAAWLLWSGLYKPLLLCLGALSVLLTLWLAVRMKLLDRQIFVLGLWPRLLRFWGWLVVEVVRANLAVARIVLAPSLPISPTLVQLRLPTPGVIGQATLANSITLTPGTLAVDAHDRELTVHCLTAQGAQELRDGEIQRRVAAALGDR